MAKKIVAVVKLQLPAGKANPAPPVGPALGQHGVNIMGFCKEYNARTQGQSGTVPVEITIYGDRSFSFVLKTPPSKDLLLKAAGVTKGSANAFSTKVGQVTRAQIKEIAQVKMPDLNAVNIEGAMLMIEGAARSMGITVVD